LAENGYPSLRLRQEVGWILGLAAHRRSHPNGGCAYGNPVIAGAPLSARRRRCRRRYRPAL